MVQIELFEEYDYNELMNEVNKFLSKLDSSRVIEIKYIIKMPVLLSGELEKYYEAMVVYSLPN